MNSKHKFLRSVTLFSFLFYVGSMTITPLVPKAHALFFEDDNGDNDPRDVKTRPDHFSLFDWVGDLDKDAKNKHYREMDDHDHGPAVNNDARTLEVITCGVVGLAAGLFIADRCTTNQNDYTTNLFIGGALGFGGGIAIGALIMPADYQVDQITQSNLKFRQAWNQDPVKLQVAKAFQPTEINLSLKF
jgi:hypothetical protein